VPNAATLKRRYAEKSGKYLQGVRVMACTVLVSLLFVLVLLRVFSLQCKGKHFGGGGAWDGALISSNISVALLAVSYTGDNMFPVLISQIPKYHISCLVQCEMFRLPFVSLASLCSHREHRLSPF
jgi:hypothetical protein